jgi:type IV fimbrial biogenesis protein FimT
MNKKGFTLIELMVVLSIIGILTSLALPSFESFIRKQESSGQINHLYTSLYLARSEAVKRNQTVTICKSSTKSHCGGDWSDGWLMFEDINNNGSFDLGESLITTGQLKTGYTLRWSAFGSTSYIRFDKNGMTASHNGTFKLCPADKDDRFASAVIVSKTARIRISQDSNQNGIKEDAAGNELSC